MLASIWRDVEIGDDSAIRLCDFVFDVKQDTRYDVLLVVRDANNRILARNSYKNAFQHPMHPKGHPSDICNELGMRVFGT